MNFTLLYIYEDDIDNFDSKKPDMVFDNYILQFVLEDFSITY